jgi:hypothetical protein
VDSVRSHPAIATRKEAVMPKLRPTLALLAAIGALAATPGVAAAQQDLRSPDARDAALTQDLRSPDARDAAAGRLPGGSDVRRRTGAEPRRRAPRGFRLAGRRRRRRHRASASCSSRRAPRC